MKTMASKLVIFAMTATLLVFGTTSCAFVTVDSGSGGSGGGEAADCPSPPIPEPGQPAFCKPCEDLEMVLSAVESPAQSWCPMLAPGHDMCPAGTQPWVCEQYQDMRPEGCIAVLNGHNGLSVQCCGLVASAVTVNCVVDADCHLPVGDPCWVNACVFQAGIKACALAPQPEGVPCAAGVACQEQYDGVPESVYCPIVL